MDELEGSTVEPEEVAPTDASAESVEDTAEVDAGGSDGEVVETESVTELDNVADSDETLSSLKDRLTPEDYEYIVGVRKEAQNYRQERNRFKEAFEGFGDEDVDTFLEAVRLLQTDPKAARGAFGNLVAELDAVLTDPDVSDDEVLNDVDSEEDDDEIPITKKDLREFLAQQEADKAVANEKRAQEEAAAKVKAEVDSQIADLGYKEGTKGFNDLMFFANSIEEGSVAEKLNQAHQKVQEARQEIIDEFLKQNEEQSDIAPSQSDGAAPTPVRNEDYKKSIKAGAKGAREFLDATFGEDDE